MKIAAGSKSQSIYVELKDIKGNSIYKLPSEFVFLTYIRDKCLPVTKKAFILQSSCDSYKPYGIYVVHERSGLCRIDIPDEAIAEGSDKVQIIIEETLDKYITCYRQEIDLTPVRIDLSQKYDESDVGTGLTIGAALSLARAAAVNRSEVVGTILRIYQNDGETVLAEFKLDSALDPTIRVPINESD
jgi:hypothetical protein